MKNKGNYILDFGMVKSRCRRLFGAFLSPLWCWNGEAGKLRLQERWSAGATQARHSCLANGFCKCPCQQKSCI